MNTHTHTHARLRARTFQLPHRREYVSFFYYSNSLLRIIIITFTKHPSDRETVRNCERRIDAGHLRDANWIAERISVLQIKTKRFVLIRISIQETCCVSCCVHTYTKSVNSAWQFLDEVFLENKRGSVIRTLINTRLDTHKINLVTGIPQVLLILHGLLL
jgi:hypothetical protein